MDDSLVAEFSSITSASPTQALQYLRLTDNNLEQAIQLFFEDPNLATEPAAESSRESPRASTASRPSHRQDSHGVIHVDSDDNDGDEDVLMTDDDRQARPDTSEDAEIARQLQEELFSTTGGDPEENRAPMLRTRETLVDPDGFDDTDINAMVERQMRERERHRRERQREFDGI
jgi:hypothetical protein